MIGNWYSSLRASRLYGVFLRHRAWTASAIQSTHLLFCFPLGTLGLVWFCLPVLILGLCLPALTTVFTLGQSLAFLMATYGIFLVATAPISLRIISDLRVGYLAGFANVLGNANPSNAFRKEAECDLAEWSATHA
ncbi:hypothetical protein FIU86_07950 [Roseovarius sp. THAF9]|uniref:hypothetical protein n=1 Tax=Roseovarius sp. THAF9 TaxID=2587847 RepID=UPI0012687594|nr:hypothetical protein [Roseovarius sp. THAF9]QFT92773.1 hypothetical protein FIU86_07950 [Roseovarius sp. THAF9]